MTPRLFAELAYLAAVIIVPAAVVSILASTCAKRSAPRLFLYLVILVSCVVAITVEVAMRWLQPYRTHASLFHDTLGAFVSWAPLFLVPSGLVWVFAKRSPTSRWIPILAVLGTVMSLPIGYILGSWVQ
jgi:hypothetical protein